MPRFIRRSVAPLLVGALSATVLVAVGTDGLPFDGLLTQAQTTPPTGPGIESDAVDFRLFDPEDLGPIDELDLEDVIDEPSELDTAAVFADLDAVGEFFGMYGYGEERRVDVAEELAQVVPPGETDAAGEVSAREAADRFLLSEQCNALFALGIREQITRPITARILRDDEELILQLDELVNENAIPEGSGVQSLSGIPESRVVRDEFGRILARPLDTTVVVGDVTVSVFDPDLIRARSPELLAGLLSSAGVPESLTTSIDPDSVVTPESMEVIWQACLGESTREGTQPIFQSIAGRSVFTLVRDDPPEVTPDPMRSGTHVVTWLESGLELRVTTNFDAVSDAMRANTEVELDTQSYLEFLADPVEPAFEVARAIATRRADPTDLLADEAFARPAGVEYGEPIAGAELQVRDFLRTATGADATATGTSTDDAGSPADRIERVVSRSAFDPGEVAANAARRFLTPIDSGATAPFFEPDGTLQQVVWQADYLNSPSFREGWRRGIDEVSEFTVGIESIVDQLVDLEALAGESEIGELIDEAGFGVTSAETKAGEASDAEESADAGDGFDDLSEARQREVVAEVVEEFVLHELGIVDFVIARREGVTRTHWLAPCYSVTTSAGVDAGNVIRAQLEARRDVFGSQADDAAVLQALAPEAAAVDFDARQRLFDEIGDRLLVDAIDLDAQAAPAVVDAALDSAAAHERFVAEIEEEPDAATVEARAAEDALRSARCSPNNLQAFRSGFPAVDADGNGIDDRIPENDVTLR